MISEMTAPVKPLYIVVCIIGHFLSNQQVRHLLQYLIRDRGPPERLSDAEFLRRFISYPGVHIMYVPGTWNIRFP